MTRDSVVRALPTSHARRIELRDAKMWRRETERELRTGHLRSKCPCTLCLFGRPLLRRTQAKHLREFGRHPIKRLQPEGEVMDSSDEEWEAAYAALDPIAQIGWRNRRRGMNRVGANLIRDVFVAADVMHNNAMSVMDGNTQLDQGGPAVGAGAEEEVTSLCTERSVHLVERMGRAAEEEFLQPSMDREGGTEHDGCMETAMERGNMSDESEAGSNDDGSMQSGSGREGRGDEDGSDDGEPLGNDSSSDGDDEYGHAGFEGACALRHESHTPLFCGSPLSRLEATLLLLNVCRTHKATNACINEMLQLLANVILPLPNSLPTSETKASTMISRLGLKYHAIDACKNGCVLFRNGNAELQTCPVCHASRFRTVGMSKVPHKVLRHFPLIPRLRRMFSTPHVAGLMTWHVENMSRDGKMRGPCDSPQWDHVRTRYSEFESDSRNVHLGLCADGLNPFGQKRSTHSLCPVLLLNYNIPPWLTIKKFFIMLGLLIPGPDAVTSDRIDVYLSPLIEELRELWTDGVMCYDAARWRGESRFTLRAILLWCIHDFPAYAMLAGTTNKGYCACPVCGPNTPSRYSDSLAKVVYGGRHRRWLPPDHPFRFDVSVFSTQELDPAPPAMDADSHIRWAYLRAEYARLGGRMGREGDPTLCSGVKRIPGLFTLPYWKDMPLRHVLDVMHIEKNISEAVLKFLFGEKDTPESRRDLEELGQRRELWLKPTANRQRFSKPHAPYVLTDAEKKIFVDEVSAIRTPTGYGSALGKHFQKSRLGGLKSHDFHCILQQILPVAIRKLLRPLQRTALIRLGKSFGRICARVVDKGEISALRLYVVESLCILEVCFPPAFFDVMQHTLIHLVDELAACGPVGGRWMYPCERYLGTLKSYVRSRSHPEASMANGYAAEEAMGFCTEYLNLDAYTSRHVWDSREDQGMRGCVVEGRGRALNMRDSDVERAHHYVIRHHERTLALRREYESEVTSNQGVEDFSRWLQSRCNQQAEVEGGDGQELRAFSSTPSKRVWSFRSMTSHGSHYRVEEEAGGAAHVTYDCGVAELRARGHPGVEQGGSVEIIRIGTLQDILVFNYHNTNVVLMAVSWLTKDTELQPRLRRDEHGFWLANMAAMPRCSRNPYILPCLASQVFFVPDKGNPGWSVVLQKEARGRRINSTEEELCIGQEESAADRELFTAMGGERREHGDENDMFNDGEAFRTGMRTRHQ